MSQVQSRVHKESITSKFDKTIPTRNKIPNTFNTDTIYRNRDPVDPKTLGQLYLWVIRDPVPTFRVRSNVV